LVSQMPCDGFSDHLAEVGGQREVAAFVELRLIESRPAPIKLATPHWPAENEHHIGVAMIGAAVAVLARGAAELRHRYHYCVFTEIAEISPESGQRLRKVAQHIGQLTFS